MSSKSSTKHQRFHEIDAIVTRRSCPQKAAAHPLFQHLTFGTRAQVNLWNAPVILCRHGGVRRTSD